MTKKERVFAIVCGMSGTGKTFFLQNYIIPKLAEKKPVVILDIMNEYKGRKHTNFAGLVSHIKKTGGLRGVNVISWKTEADAINTIRLIRYLEKPLSLIIEESHVLYSDNDTYRQIKKYLNELTLFGRHFSIDVVLSSQRPALLSTTVRSQAQFIVSFRQEERADLEYLAVRSQAAKNKVALLEPRHFFSFGNIPDQFRDLLKNETVNSLSL